MTTDVLLDNFTLQGAYCYFFEPGKPGGLYEECVSNLIECAVIYDRIYVPEDVLKINSCCKEIADRFEGIIMGKSNHKTPDIHHHLIRDEIVSQFLPFLRRKNLIKLENKEDVSFIEQMGHPYKNSIGVSMPSRTKHSFEVRTAYYTWYCLNLAAALGVNYVPNPTRVALFNNPEFMEKTPLANFQKDVLDYFEKVRTKHNEELIDVFKSLNNITLELPLIYNYVKSSSRAQDSFSATEDLITNTINLRESESAIAYRRFCNELEEALQKGDKEFMLQKESEIKKLADQWQSSLAKKKARKKLTITTPFISVVSTDIEVPWFNPSALDSKPHFVFVHSLLSKV